VWPLELLLLGLQDRYEGKLDESSQVPTALPPEFLVLPASVMSMLSCGLTVKTQEKAESLIKLPESSKTIKPILEFCYTGTYGEDSVDTSEKQALQNTKLYLAAAKYDIRGMDDVIYLRFMFHIDACEDYLARFHKERATDKPLDGPKEVTEGEMGKKCPHEEQVEEATVKAQTVWDGLLLAVRTLLDNSREDDSIRQSLGEIGWTSIALDQFRSDWLELVAAHPAYAFDVLVAQTTEKWQLDTIKSRAEAEIAACPPSDDWDPKNLRDQWSGCERWFDRILQILSEE